MELLVIIIALLLQEVEATQHFPLLLQREAAVEVVIQVHLEHQVVLVAQVVLEVVVVFLLLVVLLHHLDKVMQEVAAIPQVQNRMVRAAAEVQVQ